MAEVRRVLGSSLHYDERYGLYTLDGEPFTGVSYSVWPNGRLDSESELRDGLNWGVSRSWYSTGQPLGEATMRAGVLHGRSREWHTNGQFAEDGEYEYGIALWERKWDEAGALVEEYTLTEADRNFELLRSFRRTYGGSQDAEPGAAADGGA